MEFTLPFIIEMFECVLVISLPYQRDAKILSAIFN